MTIHQRRLKVIAFTIGDDVENSFECQVQSWTLDPGIDDGDLQWSYCATDNSFIEETDPQPTLDLTFWSDWRSEGVSAYLWDHKGEVATFALDHHPDIPEEHVRWTGSLLVRPGPAGGDARTTEQTEVTLQIVPDSLMFERVDAS
jgi:hypothetical protein